MGFFLGFLCGLLFIPLCGLAGVYLFFTYSESYAEKQKLLHEQAVQKEKEQEASDLNDMPSALYASYLGQRYNNGAGLSYVPEHLDPQYQFSGWVSVKRIPEVDHRIIEPSLKKENKKKASHPNGNNRKGSHNGTTFDSEGSHGAGVAGSLGAGAAGVDSRFTFLDTQNLHLSLPPSLQARFKDSKYAVIKGPTMFIYENEQLEECLGVITLPHYEITVPGHQKDSHVFSKRNPIWLKYQPSSSHSRHSTASSESGLMNSSKDYYLSMVSCVDKEDLYFTLLRCCKLKPNVHSFIREIPKRDSTLFDKPAMNKLIRNIHSNEHHFQAAWLNAIIGRMFLGVYKTPQIKDAIFQKLVDKLSRVRLPNFLNDIRMKSVHLGDGVPMITRPKLLTLKPNGDMTMDMSIHYQGGFRAEVEAEAVVTVTKKIQPIKVSLVLVITLMRLEGRMQVWIKPPPCNRAWYGFYHTPHVEMKIEPVVSDKQIKSNLILKAIENKLMEAIAETMVLPNMDDVPFSDSEGIGGIFGEDILPGGEAASTSSQQPQQQPLQTQAQTSGVKWPHIPASRSATINVATDGAGHIRHGTDHPSEVRHRAETISISSIYQNTRATKSHTSLGDELMVNYSYETSTNQMTSPLDYDPMLSGGQQGGNRSGPLSESPEALPAKRMGGRPADQSSTATTDRGCGHGKFLNLGFGNNNNCNNNTNTNTDSSSNANVNGNPPGFSHHRRGSLDPAMGYSTGSTFGGNIHPGMESMRVMEEKWSHYGISEYDPQSNEGGKVHVKEKKKFREKDKHKGGQEADRVSVHSKDSGDTGSLYTTTTRWTEGTGMGQSTYGSSSGAGSSYSTLLDTNSTSSRSEKFSLSKMFQGFRKKHTKGALSGSSIQLNNNSTEILEGNEDEAQDMGSTLIGDGAEYETENRKQRHNSDPMEALPFHDYVAPVDGQTTATPAIQLSETTLSDAYQPQFRQKFESTPNLTSISFSSDPKSGGAALTGTGSTLRGDDKEPVPMARSGSPARSVYAASLFGGDESGMLSMSSSGVNGFSKSPPSANSQSSQQQQQQNLRLSPHLGSALRKLRNRSHGGSGSSKEELSIPPGDLNVVLKQLQQQQQQLQLQHHGLDSSAQTVNDNSGQDGKPVSVNGTAREDHELFSRESIGTSLSPIQDQPDFESPIDSAPPSASAVASRAIGAPTIVLQKASPYLDQGDSHTHDDEAIPYDGKVRQYNPESQSMRQQPQEPTSVRLDRNLVHQPGQKPLEIETGRSSPTSGGRPRRHSINQAPTINPGGFSIHTHGYGLGVGGATPTSPLRKEFSRDDDSDSNDNDQQDHDNEKERTEMTEPPYDNPAWIASRVRNSSDTLSTNSGHSSVSNSTKESQVHSQHSHSLKSILSSLGNKHKKKGHGSATTGGNGYSVVNNQDPYSIVGLVGIAGAIAVEHMSVTALDTDPYAGVGLPQEALQHKNNSQEELSPRGRGPEGGFTNLPLGPPAELDDPRLPGGFKPYEPEEAGVTEKKEKVKKQEECLVRDAMHARPGYIGEYPTPVRMHSFLNRQGAAIRAEAEAEEQESREQTNMFESTPPTSFKPISRSSSPLPHPKESLPIVKSTSLPTPPKSSMLPEASPRALSGDEILMSMPVVETPSSESSTQSSLTFDRQSSTTASSISSFSLRETASYRSENLMMDGTALQSEYYQEHLMDGVAATGTAGQTMTRHEYDMIMFSHSMPLQTNDVIGIPTTNPVATADVEDAIANASSTEERGGFSNIGMGQQPHPLFGTSPMSGGQGSESEPPQDRSLAVNTDERLRGLGSDPHMTPQQQQDPVESLPLEETPYTLENPKILGQDDGKVDEGALAAAGPSDDYPSPEELRHEQAFMNQPSLAVPNSSSGSGSGAGAGAGSAMAPTVPGSSKKHHRNFFKRFIRRKSSEDIAGDASQAQALPEISPKRNRFLFHSGKSTGPTSPTSSSSSLYLNPASSQSMSAVGSGLNSALNIALPYSQGLRGGTSTEFVRSRAQSTSASEEAILATVSGSLLSPVTKATRTRPRSSTVNAMPSVR
ncbi:hypothetical protein BGW38_008279 [Lunasporangiospora selenospora]|uniref:SMP-LTD domain-containing protein n=1 Tax=Lunasporangiospora selenospora TaxID=979761 RepID=A0A9P6G035_9FUNG|nr:hypothetical protein BGW38_008279 [Lunasporangiospora selenospora]